ncbi:MAG: hypothetical protein F6K31_34510 [Symploca sp. SIO2G7]|nr:hypothetical protein [Symploca sp. SIO2G7]
MYRSFVFVSLLTVFGVVGNTALAEDHSHYDAELAAELGADEYGMRPYVMAFLKAGPNRSDDPDQAAELQRRHLEHVRSLAEAGHLVLAGPFMDDGDTRGIFIFATDDVDQARAWTEADPAIQAGSLVMDIRPWYGSAALLQMVELHARIARSNP